MIIAVAVPVGESRKLQKRNRKKRRRDKQNRECAHDLLSAGHRERFFREKRSERTHCKKKKDKMQDPDKDKIRHRYGKAPISQRQKDIQKEKNRTEQQSNL
jgi:hypothetical protein